MSKFDQLIRLRDWELDEKRRHLGQLRAELESIAGRKQALLDRIEQKKAAAQKDYAGGIARGLSWNLEKKLAMIDEEIAAQEAPHRGGSGCGIGCLCGGEESRRHGISKRNETHPPWPDRAGGTRRDGPADGAASAGVDQSRGEGSLREPIFALTLLYLIV